MIDVLAVTSYVERIGERPITAISDQLAFLESVGITTQLLLDPSAVDFERKIREGGIGCVYLTPLRCPNESDVDTRLLNRHMEFTRLLQHLGQPFIGQDFASQLSINDKTLCAFVSQSHPPGWLITKDDIQCGLFSQLVDEIPVNAFPMLVKPNTLWAGMGISTESIGRNKRDVIPAVTRLFERFPHLREVRVETYIENAREATIAMVGNDDDLIVGVTELLADAGQASINGEQEKTAASSCKLIRYRPWPSDEFRPQLEQLGKELFSRFAFRDVARFDVMVREKPFVVDVNDMPFLGNAFCCDLTSRFGITPECLLAVILAAFNRRIPTAKQRINFSEAFWSSLPPLFHFGRKRASDNAETDRDII